jgi:hypothetical protein
VLTRRKIAWLLLVISFCIGCTTIYWYNFIDEADNLVAGWLITRGAILYRDLFSHHFPFPYYWTASVIWLFGKSILNVRLSVWLFQIASFATAMELSSYYLTLGFAAFIWSVIRIFYSGNMVLYSSFCAPSILVVFCITLAAVQNKIKMDWKHCIAVGVFSTVSFLSDPLSVYAIVVATIFLLTSNSRKAAISILYVLVGLVCCSLLLVSSGAFKAFIDYALIFNTQIYSKYVYTNPLRLYKMLEMVVKGLGITDNNWFNFDLLRPITGKDGQFDAWFFTGFLYRFSIIASSIFLAFKKQYRAAILVYLFAAALLVIEKSTFRGQPFIMLSSVAISATVSGELWHRDKQKILNIAQRIVAVSCCLLVAWMLIRSTHFLVKNRNLFLYENIFGASEADALDVKSLTCGQANVKLAIYPGSTYTYWFTEMRPVSKYLFMWPWVAEIAQDDVIKELGEKDELAVVIIDSPPLWGKYFPKQYLNHLHDYLTKHYMHESDDVFISPELAKRCNDVKVR